MNKNKRLLELVCSYLMTHTVCVCMLISLISCNLRDGSDAKKNDIHDRYSEHKGIQLFVASSLNRIVKRWKISRNIDVGIQSASSSKIKRWIDHGQRPDLFISADLKSIRPLFKTQSLSWMRTFACTPLVVVTRATKHRPSSIRPLPSITLSFERWSSQDQGSLAIAMDTVPLGIYTRELLLKGEIKWGRSWQKRIKKRIVAQGINARSTSMYVRVKEVESAFLYYVNALEMKRNDANLQILHPPEEVSTHATYWIGGRDLHTQQLALDLINFAITPKSPSQPTGLSQCSAPLNDE